jgi:hypothetical protein
MPEILYHLMNKFVRDMVEKSNKNIVEFLIIHITNGKYISGT